MAKVRPVFCVAKPLKLFFLQSKTQKRKQENRSASEYVVATEQPAKKDKKKERQAELL